MIASLIAPIIFFAGCSEDTTKPDEDNASFVVADSASLAISLEPGMQITDESTGLTFSFPAGGSGMLTTGRLSEAPERPWTGGAGYYLAYQGEEPVQLRLLDEPDGYLFVLGYGTPSGSRSDGRRACWHALPPVEIEESATARAFIYRIAGPASEGEECQGTSYYWVSRFTAGSDLAVRFSDAVATANEIMAAFDDSLAALFAGIDVARTPAELPATFYPDGYYYSGFTRSCGPWAPATEPMIGIGLGSSPRRIGHEIGHYLTQLLIGDAAYSEFEEQMIAEPGIGKVFEGRAGLVEDYAHYLDFLLTGDINGANDPDLPGTFFPAGTAPAQSDVPALEGYGVLLLRALSRVDSTIVNIRGETVKVPPVSLATGDILRILSSGISRMDALRERVAAELDARGMAERLAPLAAATGWLPSAQGRVVGRTWRPLEGAQVRAIATADGREFFSSSESATSDDQGWFKLPAFPGEQILRVTAGADSFDFDFGVPWERATDDAVITDNLFIWPDLTTLSKIQVTIGLRFTIPPEDTLTPPLWEAVGGFTCGDLLGHFEQDHFYVDSYVDFPDADPVWSLDTLAVRYSLATGDVSELVLRAAHVEEASTLLVTGLPGLKARVAGSKMMEFAQLKNVSADEVRSLFDLVLTGPEGQVYTEDDLAGDGQIIVLKLEAQ